MVDPSEAELAPVDTEMCSGSEAGSYLTLLNFVSLNSRLKSNQEEEKPL